MYKVLLAGLLILMLVGTANAMDLEVGTSLDFTLSKDIDVEGVEVTYHSQNYGIVGAINPEQMKWLRVNVGAGTTTNSLTLETNLGDVVFESNVGFNLSVEAEADIFLIDIVDVSLLGAYRYSRTKLDKIKAFGIEITNPLKSIIPIHNWEIGILASKDLGFIKESLDIIELYAGAVYSDFSGDVETKLNTAITRNTRLKAIDNFGLRCGINVVAFDSINASLDLKFLDEVSVGGALTYSF